MSQYSYKLSLPDVQVNSIHSPENSLYISFFIPANIFKCQINGFNDSHSSCSFALLIY